MTAALTKTCSRYSFPKPQLYKLSLLAVLFTIQCFSILTKSAPTNTKPNDDGSSTNQKGFVEAFVASISVILVSEIGDKTFFIAAIMSAQYNRLTVFIGAMSALAIMTALSAAMGSLTTALIKVEYTQFISNVLFVIFGLKSLRDGMNMSADDISEFHETDQELKEAANDDEEKLLADGSIASSRPQGIKNLLQYCMSKVLITAFTMTFLAEWGDRSQLTTVILATHDNPYGVTAGGCLGHFICTGCAVLGGRMIAQKISVKSITIFGGIVFLAFAVHGFAMLALQNTSENSASLS